MALRSSEASDAGMLNIAAIVGETVTFTCRYNFTLNPSLPWSYYEPQDKIHRQWIGSDNITLSNFSFRFKLDVDRQNGLSKLTITNVQLADGGMYVCERKSGNRTLFLLSADLTVLGEIFI